MNPTVITMVLGRYLIILMSTILAAALKRNNSVLHDNPLRGRRQILEGLGIQAETIDTGVSINGGIRFVSYNPMTATTLDALNTIGDVLAEDQKVYFIGLLGTSKSWSSTVEPLALTKPRNTISGLYRDPPNSPKGANISDSPPDLL